MKGLIIACLIAGLIAVATSKVLRFESLTHVDKQWEDFKTTNHKKYESIHEESARKDIFLGNLKKIEMHNYLHDKGVKTFRLGVNEFADMGSEEFRSVMNGYKPNNYTKHPRDKMSYLGLSPFLKVSLPSSVDWREQGAVTPVKNQGQCGSCWSFSATGSLEGQHFRQTGKLVSLSEQNLVDCSTEWGNNGCNGGLMDNAFQYIKDNDGIDTEKSYPYMGDEETCHFKSRSVGATDGGAVDLPSGDEEAVKEAVASIGPIAIAIDASHQSFQLYASGVYVEPECSSSQLDHGVLIAGYGTEDGQDYWLIKNSWGPTWGREGYIYMARNKENQCGVASQASYPVV